MSAVSSGRLAAWTQPRLSLAIATIGAVIALLVAAIAVGRVSAVGLVIIGLALAVVVAFASLRWPRTVIVLVILTPILDRYIIADWLPATVATLAHFLSEAMLVTVGAALATQAWRNGRLLPALRHPTTIGLAAFLAIALLSAVLNAVPPPVATLGLSFTLDAAACFFLPRLVGFSTRQSLLAVGVLVGLVTVSALGGLAQWTLRPDFMGMLAVQGRYGEVYRLASIFSDPNTFGALLIAVIPFAAFAVVSLRRPGYRVAALLLAILLFTPLFLSFSRGAWVGLAVGGGLAMALINWRALVVTAAVAAVSFWLAIEVPREVLVPTEGPGSNPPNQPSLVDSTVARFNEIGAGKDLRTELVVNALPIVRDHPVLGVGPGRFGGATSWLFGSPVYAEYGTDDVFAGSPQTKTADNFWLHIVVETGALGLAAFLAASLAAGIPILLAARRAQGWYRVLLGGIAAGTAALAANAVTTMLLEANAVAFFTWFLLGIGSLLVARVDAERQGEAAPESLPAT